MLNPHIIIGMTELELSIVERIRSSMKTRGVTQASLADAIGVQQYTISRMLAGSPFPSVDQLCRIAERLDVSLYYLLGVQEPSYRELSPDVARIADAYNRADPVVQDVVKYLLSKK